MIRKFNKSLYKVSAIKQAVDDFNHLADFDLSENHGQIKVKIANIRDKNLTTVFADEFANYILAMQGTADD